VDDWEEDDTKGAKSCSVDSKHPLWDLLSLAILPFGGEVTLMRSPRFLIGSNVRLPILLMTVLIITTRAPAQEKILHNFGNGRDGGSPGSTLVFDAAGNLYGTTASGGEYGYGTVFELTPKAGVGWSEKILYNFNKGGDGEDPGASIVFDSAGNLYGTTFAGGLYGYGTVFELTPEATGGWSQRILYNFNNNGTDGYWPFYGPIIDVVGNLYGTTYQGGLNDGGTVFELSPAAGGVWTETILYSFNPNDGDGFYPAAGLVFDLVGSLYGTTSEGGTSGYGGTVFELSPAAGGKWTEKVLRDCDSGDGWDPKAGVVFDSAGNLYGTTQYLGSADGGGTVFRLTPNEDGTWTNRVLQNFNSIGSDGFYPLGLVLDSAGNLYGTTADGGSYSAGVAFRMSTNIRGSEKILLNFGGKAGYGPLAGPILDSAGNLYGTAYAGGAYGGGVVYEITP
jgi:uncharacterized repeat protein (TIGR03803 family)